MTREFLNDREDDKPRSTAKLRAIFNQKPFIDHARLDELTCKASICRIQASAPSESALGLGMSQLFGKGRSPLDEFHHKMQLAEHTTFPGGARATVFIVRGVNLNGKIQHPTE